MATKKTTTTSTSTKKKTAVKAEPFVVTGTSAISNERKTCPNAALKLALNTNIAMPSIEEITAAAHKQMEDTVLKEFPQLAQSQQPTGQEPKKYSGNWAEGINEYNKAKHEK